MQESRNLISFMLQYSATYNIEVYFKWFPLCYSYVFLVGTYQYTALVKRVNS